MENAQDPGPRNKPNRPQGKPGSANRKPQPVKKPAGKRPAASKPPTSRPSPAVGSGKSSPAKPAEAAEVAPLDDVVIAAAAEVEIDSAPEVEVEAPAEAVALPTWADAQKAAAAADAPEAAAAPRETAEKDAAEPALGEHAPATRLNVARLTLPKLNLPKFSIGRSKTDDELAGEEPPVDLDAAVPATEDDAPERGTASEAQPASQVETASELEPASEAAPETEPAPEAKTTSTGRTPKTAAIPVVQPKIGSIAVVKSAEVVAAPQAGSAVAKQAGSAVEPKKKAARNSEIVLLVEGLTKKFDDKLAVNSVDLEVKVGAFYGIVGPNGAGKTTTLSMITGLLRPDAGAVAVHGADVWSDPVVAKRNMGVLPDRLRLFDRLTGAQVLYYAGVLRGLADTTVRKRTTDLAGAFGLEEALGRLVTDYSAGMTKKIALAAAMIHSPRILVLDEPFESVDPVSAATITDILKNYAEAGGTVVLSSHSMDLVQRICDHVAVIVGGDLLADGTMASVRNGQTLEERFVELAGGRKSVEGLEWLHSFSD